MSRDVNLYLDDIESSCGKIMKYVQSVHLIQFYEDEKTYDAVVRNLEVIGEAAKHIPESILKQFSDIDWKKIKGLRDIIVHEYFGLDIDIIWDIAKNKIPFLLDSVQKYRLTT